MLRSDANMRNLRNLEMKLTARALLHAGVIAGAAFMLTAMSTLGTARSAHARDMSEVEASADVESPDINVVGSWVGTNHR